MNCFGNDQDSRVLDPDILTMESMNCPDGEPLLFYQDSSTSYWQYGPSVDISSGHITADTMPLADYGPSCAGQWPTLDYPSPSSDQSSMGRAPSSNTSYNEPDSAEPFLESSSPENSLFGTRTQSPTFTTIAPRPNTCGSDVLFDLREPAPVAIPRAITSVEPKCTEGCKGKTFGRQYELDRHIREQHRCPHEDCADVRFSSSKEKREHERHHSEIGLGYRCGTCLLDPKQSKPTKPLSRGEKLKKHFKDFHGVDDDFDFRDFQCMKDRCYVSKAYGGIFFAFRHELEEHEKQEHSGLSARTELSECRADASSGTMYDSFPSGEKRPLNSASVSDAKRGKTRQVDSVVTAPAPHAYSVLHPEDRLGDSPHAIRPQVDGPSISSNAHLMSFSASEPEKAFPLSVVELRALTKHQSWNSLIEELHALGISPIFNSREGAIKLRGPCSSQLDRGKDLLEVLIHGIRARTPDTGNSNMADGRRLKAPHHQQVSIRAQPEIYALDSKENADVLALWNKRLLPRFPSIVQEAKIDGSYSVSLVLQKADGGLHPIIRFRSSRGQNTESREAVKDLVKSICDENGSPRLHVQFTKGTLVRLVGGSLEASILDDPSNDQRFPHERRPWHTPGLSASIGLSDCPHVSATLGGYISVDDRIYMLTVDHFISECPCSMSWEVRSPSISDISDVKDQLYKKIDDLSLRIRQTAPNEIPLGQVQELLFAGDIDEELEQYKRFERDLKGDDSQFAFARVRERCGVSQPPLRPSTNPFIPLPGALHRMDWSLSEVNVSHRMGKNIHRHGRVHEPTLRHLQAEVSRPGGLGPLCTATSEVFARESAYYVGTTSGFREGFVNPALVQYGDEYGITHEWALVVPGCEWLGDRDFQGDSGAWIMSNDDKLMGLLWGWDNGNLLFTPIQDVFADIAQKMQVDTHQIKLPEYSGPHSRQGSLLCRGINGALRTVSAQGVERPMELPITPQILRSPTIDHEKLRRRRSSGADSACSISSTPSLLSSASSFAEDIATRVHTPQGPVPPSLPAALPIRTKARAVPGDEEAIEEWVCIQCDGNAIDISALRLATGVPDTAIPYTRA
ncbi:hypothetical protein K458DRAFT_194090 [Lentithecium fluviatile CBS 122367]|uniref:C2H2-type domain-containing protein n=1 Tax=Lentithecium fluviatile CBS 122367 TaxID=1168545 RepID=A0A6G1IDV3_9PLEO|nr:hypothetical protein K458DRAFT_194090 [Lentithecium fluviatile CBS 122367]